jgi:small subunit ribosomal protein S17e
VAEGGSSAPVLEAPPSSSALRHAIKYLDQGICEYRRSRVPDFGGRGADRVLPDRVITTTRVGPARMGNIRQTYIKRVAIELIRHYPEDFTGDFAQNKLKVLQLTDLGVTVEGHLQASHKKLANRIAGYATRYVKRKRGT